MSTARGKVVTAMTSARQPLGPAAHRIHDFVERYTAWMKEVAAQHDPTTAAALADLMKGRLAAEIDEFVEVELRLRAFERRAPDQLRLKIVGNDA